MFCANMFWVLLTASALFQVAFTSVTVAQFSTLAPWCTLDELHGCIRSLMTVSKENDFNYVATRGQLQMVCNSMRESIICIDRHARNCFTPTQRKVFNHVVAGARQVLKDLCIPGPIQEAYLRFAPCYQNITLSEDKCAPKYRNLIYRSENVNEEDVEDGLREACCAFHEFVVCKYIFVAKVCVPEAHRFLEQYLDRITSPLLHEHCALYTYVPGTCSPATRNTISFITVTAFVMVALAINMLQRATRVTGFANG